MRRLGAAPEQCVVFEDSGSGVRAGVAAGVATVGLRTALSDAQLKATGATTSMADWREYVPTLVHVGQLNLTPTHSNN